MYLAEHLRKDHAVADSWMRGKTFGFLRDYHLGLVPTTVPHTHDSTRFNDPVYPQEGKIDGKV